jgi:hypothetical protein
MKLTNKLLEAKIKEYIDESYAFGDSDVELSENVLKTMNGFLFESKGEITKTMLLEMANNSTGESKEIINDFILYLENS